MSDQIRKFLESKREMRQCLAALTFANKVKLLEQLRDRSLVIAASGFKKPLSHQY